MKKKFIVSLTFLIIISFFLIFLISLYKPYGYNEKLNLNKNIPEFTALDLYSNELIKLDHIIKNKNFTLLNIWASWCAPCRLEHQYLMELSKENKIDIVGINYKDQSDNAKKFILDYGNPYSRILTDLDGTKSIQLGAFGVPETYVINNFDKKIIKKYVGPIDEKKFKQILKIIK
tara:strand:+ start:608 stop:1132 length:525 start_codon:yes stop_codon:yes gene_type:complete